jgi:hypothetical protein
MLKHRYYSRTPEMLSAPFFNVQPSTHPPEASMKKGMKQSSHSKNWLSHHKN